MAEAIGKFIGALLGVVIGVLIKAGIVWCLIWGLTKLGVTTICGWTVAFSWPLVIVVVAATLLLKSIFSGFKREKEE